MTTYQLAFTEVNYERILAVQRAFGPTGKTLVLPGRVLVGKGRLAKRSRRRLQPKYFFLFSDVLVYGTALVSGRWFQKQKIIRLDDIEIEDLEDSASMEHHWLIRTPRKSFYVAAASAEEKHAWMTRIVDCRNNLRRKSAPTAPLGAAYPEDDPRTEYAPTWIPDDVSAVCMRCFSKFTPTNRRHHCRGCGFLVCAGCSKGRALLRHIHRSEMQRVCRLCHDLLRTSKAQVRPDGRRGNSVCDCGEDEERDSGEDMMVVGSQYDSCWWLGQPQLSPYIYLNPEHLLPPPPPPREHLL